MGSGVSVPNDSREVADLLAVLPEEERAELNLMSPCKGEVNNGVDIDDGVPRQIKEKVARLVANAMVSSPEQGCVSMNSSMLEHLSSLPRILYSIVSPGDRDTRRNATEQVRRFLSIEKDPPIQVVIDAGIVPMLVTFLDDFEDSVLQLESGWALTNIASGSSAQTDTVIDAGAIPAFIRLLRESCNIQVREQAVWALGNIAGDSTLRRDQVLEAGVLSVLIPELASNLALHDACSVDDAHSQGLLKNGVWLLSNLCRGKPRVKLSAVKPALQLLSRILCSVDVEETLVDALWAVSYLSDGDQANIDAVLYSNLTDASYDGESKHDASCPGPLCFRLVELLTHPVYSIRTPALRCIGNLVTGDDTSTEQVVRLPGCLGALRSLLLTPVPPDPRRRKGLAALKKESCWCLSNITAGTTGQIEAIFQAELIGPLLALAALDEDLRGRTRRREDEREADQQPDRTPDRTPEKPSARLGAGAADVQKEATWAVANAASGSSKRQVRYLVRAGACRALCSALGNTRDTRVAAVAADGLTHILRKAGGDGRRRRSLMKGTAAFKWRKRVVKAIRDCGGDSALKRIAAKGGRGKKSEGSSEAASKASSLLSLIALTKQMLTRAKRGDEDHDMDDIDDHDDEDDDVEDEEEDLCDELETPADSADPREKGDPAEVMDAPSSSGPFGEWEWEGHSTPGRVVQVRPTSRKDLELLSPSKERVVVTYAESKEPDHIRSAMDALEQELGLVRVDDDTAGKRGWASAWDL